MVQEEARDGAVAVTLADRCLVALVYLGG
eukprot:COSAG06_NODE_25703_length_630_cov_2.546139_1_plen_28_part_01